MKKVLCYFSVVLLVLIISCKKNPDTTMVFHITNDTQGPWVINMSSQYKNDVESSTTGTFDKSLTVPGEYNVLATSWQCHITNNNNLPSNISITMTFQNGTPHTCTSSTTTDLWCQGQ